MPRKMPFEQTMIWEMSKGSINPAGVAASMRLEYGTLGHLSRDVFRKEIRLAREAEKAEPGFLRAVAGSYGAGKDYDYWEQKLAEKKAKGSKPTMRPTNGRKPRSRRL